jgi:hypothetical protein
MTTKRRFSLRRHLRQAASFFGMVALSALTVLLAQRVLAPSSATAQAGQAQEVRASAFVLVGADGSVLGRFQTGPAANGQLQLLDAAGKTRTVLTGNGSMVVFDADGATPRFEAGYRLTAGANGVPPVNGVLIDPTGTVGPLPASP